MYTDKPTFTHIQRANSDSEVELETSETVCVAYYRVSTDRQGKSGLGLEAQQKAVANFTKSRGWVIVAELTEVESGKRKDRPQLAEAIAVAKKLKGKLVIAKLDRLARNVHFISGLMESKVDFIAIDMPNADKFMLHIFSAMAEEEGRRISERTRAALAVAKARGVKLGQNGNMLAKQNRLEAEAFARSLEQIVIAIRRDGKTTIREITEALNQKGISSREGGRWHLRSTSLLLRRLVEK